MKGNEQKLESQENSKFERHDFKLYYITTIIFFSIISMCILFMIYFSNDKDYMDTSLKYALFVFFILSLLAALLLMRTIVPTNDIHTRRFIDIDESTIKESDASKQSSSYKITGIIDDDLLSTDSFSSCFQSIIHSFNVQIRISSEKASLLLDKGVVYAKAGIYFYISSIILFQSIMWYFEFRPYLLYGTICCSLVFFFIEFLSAWFLKQYRHYIDTSLYLTRIKSIFERYLLIYLASKERIDNDIDFSHLFQTLTEEIKWPEPGLLKKSDISFAKECLETATSLVHSLKENPEK